MGITVNGSGGSGGSGTSASDMIYGGPVGGTTPWVNVKGQDGYGWAGGAGAVQGNAATFSTGSGTASNEALSFNIGSTIASLNATYGAGNWTITNPTLTFASANFVQNNSRFGVGGGGFNIYYVANNQWGQSEAGTGGTYSPNPIYADGINQSATAAQKTLNTWAGSSSLLGTETYSTTALARATSPAVLGSVLVMGPSVLEHCSLPAEGRLTSTNPTALPRTRAS